MTYRLIVKPEAEADIDETKRWYRRQRKRLATEFVEEVGKILARLQRMPKIHGALYKDVRRTRLARFPYTVFYRVVRRQVRILAVMHQRRDPAAWQSRADAD